MSRFQPGDRVQLDMPGDPNDGLIGIVEPAHPVYHGKPWNAVRINGHIVNLADIFLKEPTA